MDEQHWSWGGIQLIWVVLGILGAAMGIGSMPPMSTKQCWVALGSGVFFASYGPQWASYAFVHWIPAWLNPAHDPMPSFMTGSVAFFCGVGGLFLIPGVIAFWKNPREFVRDVWGAITTSRSKEGGP